MAIQTGVVRVVFGVQQTKPILNAPEGKCRLVMRAGKVARFYVKRENSIREFLLEDKGETWHCRFEQGKNLRSAQDVLTDHEGIA